MLATMAVSDATRPRSRCASTRSGLLRADHAQLQQPTMITLKQAPSDSILSLSPYDATASSTGASALDLHQLLVL